MPTKGNVTRPRIEPMLMIRPSCCRRMEGSTARVTRSSPMTFVSKIAFACSVVKASVTPAEAMPALLTSTSILPASASTVLTPASTDASSLTSSSTISMPSLRWASAALRFLPCAPRIEAYTVWPARRRVSAVSRPKPLLAPVVFGLGEELGSSGRPDLRCRGDVRDADVEEGADLVGVGRRGEGDRGFVVGRAAAVVEDEPRVRYLQDDWIALEQDSPAEHGLVEVTGAVLVGDHEKEGDEEVPFSPGVLVLAHLFPFWLGTVPA